MADVKSVRVLVVIGTILVSAAATSRSVAENGSAEASDEPVGALGLRARSAIAGPSPPGDSTKGAERPNLTPDSENQTRVEFRAGRVDVDAELQWLMLAGDVEVLVDRYRLTSERLQLRRGARGLEVEGNGRVGFCPCDSAPITFGFSSATVAPPTDLLLVDPTLRVGGVPVCWAPYLWLRSPRRRGLLPPELAWRGDDGLFFGSGVHWPLGLEADGGSSNALDLRVSGYARGGAEVRGSLSSANSTTRWRWDWLGRSLAALDSHGAILSDGRDGMAWRLDVLRGDRGLVAYAPLPTVASRYDRARGTLIFARDNVALGWGIYGSAPRGGQWDANSGVGPRFDLGAGATFAPEHQIDASVHGWATHAADGDVSTWWAASAVGGTFHPSPLVVEWRSGAAGVVQIAEQSTASVAFGGVALRVGMPYVRNFGEQNRPIWHWVEPFVLAAGIKPTEVGADGSYGDIAGGRVFSGVGIRSALEARATRAGVDATFGAGALWRTPSRAVRLGLGRVRAQSESISTSVDLMWLPKVAVVDEAAVRVALRLGAPESWHIRTRVDGRRGAAVAEGNWLSSQPWQGATGTWFDVEGWSTGVDVGIPWANWLATSLGGDADLSRRELLGIRADVGYRHPCGCLALLAHGRQRLGRPGYDVGVGVDLMP